MRRATIPTVAREPIGGLEPGHFVTFIFRQGDGEAPAVATKKEAERPPFLLNRKNSSAKNSSVSDGGEAQRLEIDHLGGGDGERSLREIVIGIYSAEGCDL